MQVVVAIDSNLNVDQALKVRKELEDAGGTIVVSKGNILTLEFDNLDKLNQLEDKKWKILSS